MTRNVSSQIQNFRGLNDRRKLPGLAPGEIADGLNFELSQRAFEKRLGFTRLGGPLKDCSTRLDGVNDYLRITNQSTYTPATNGTFYFGIALVLRSRPTTAVTIASWGFGAAADLFFDLRYDPTAGTGSLGAWVFRVRDNGATLTYTLDDGDGGVRPEGNYRFIEINDTLSGSEATLFSDTAVLTQDTDISWSSLNWNSAQDLFIGVGTTAANTIGTDFASVTVAEIRYSVSTLGNILGILHASDATSNYFYRRELTDAAKAVCNGYWKCNDGDDAGVCHDYAGTNDAIIPNNPPPWVLASDEPLVLGEAAIRFKGGNEWLDVRDITTIAPTTVAQVFTSYGGNVADWTVRGIYIPELLPGAATVADGVVFWSGTSTTLPAPVGLRIVSDKFAFIYNDNGTARTTTLTGAVSGGTAPTVTSLVGKRVRWTAAMPAGGASAFVTQIVVDNGAGVANSVYTLFGSYVPSASGPTTISQDWAFGRHVTNFAAARLGSTTVFHTDGPLVGVLDDVQIIKGYLIAAPAGIPNLGVFPFQEQSSWPGYAVGLALYLRLNDGAGTGLLDSTGFGSGTNGGWNCYLRPEADEGASWDVGLVEPHRPVRGTMVASYDNFLADGTHTRALILVSGVTVYEYTAANGLRVVGPLFARAAAMTHAKYGRRLLLAGAVGRRPMIYDGSLRGVGIPAPHAASIVTTSNAAGSLAAGQYYLYVTFRNRNPEGGSVESNPSPGVLVTITAPDDTIDSVQLPTSTDPQVNQRRIWMTAVAVSATDGETAYLVATVDDNTTTTYTTDILTVSTSAETLEYFEHAEAPDGTTVGQFLDYTLLGGNQRLPTRLYYSSVGAPDYWNPAVDGRYLDLDLDSGNPILGIAPLLDRAIVDMGDGKWGIFATGDIDRPLDKTRLNDTHGAVGPQASIVVNNQQWYIGESDLYLSDGYRETNISSPDEPPATAPVYIQQLGKTSIQALFRSKMDWSGRARFAVIEHRARSQIWFCVRMTDASSQIDDTNTHVIAYDTVQGFFSRYDLPIDCGALVEISSERAEVVGITQGWLVKYDQDTGEGAASTGVLTATSRTSASTGTLIGFSGTPFTGLDLRWIRAFIYHKADHTIVERRIIGVPSTASLLLEDADATLAVGDLLIAGAAPYFGDFAVSFGNPLSTKALLGVAVGAELVSAAADLRVQHKGDVRALPATLSGFATRYLTLSATIVTRWLGLGGLGVTFYVRVSETGYAAGTALGVFPGGGSFRLHGLAFEGQEKGSRSRS